MLGLLLEVVMLLGMDWLSISTCVGLWSTVAARTLPTLRALLNFLGFHLAAKSSDWFGFLWRNLKLLAYSVFGDTCCLRASFSKTDPSLRVYFFV